MMARFDVGDEAFAHACGIDLAGEERIRALQAERDGAFETVDRLRESLTAYRESRRKWKRRCVGVVGVLMLLVVIDLGMFGCLWLVRG